MEFIALSIDSEGNLLCSRWCLQEPFPNLKKSEVHRVSGYPVLITGYNKSKVKVLQKVEIQGLEF